MGHGYFSGPTKVALKDGDGNRKFQNGRKMFWAGAAWDIDAAQGRLIGLGRSYRWIVNLSKYRSVNI
jgi:hypothetical protein